MKRIISFLLALTLTLTLLPLPSLAAETATDRQSFTVAADPGVGDNDTLFASYAQQLFSSETSLPAYNAAGKRLSGDIKKMYDALVPVLRKIAQGRRSDTTVSLGRTVRFQGKTYEPDVEVSFTGSSFTGSDLRALLTALLTDLPYELYWYDKTAGCATEMFCGSTLLYIDLKFTAAKNYRTGTYKTDTDKTSAAANAVKNAKYIVSCLADAPDYGKLLGYADAICDLTSYNHSAASKGSYAKNNDPWQLIHVFDGDPDTKVVCEGYAKAYQYLCGRSSFKGNVECHTVTGTMNGGAHMWNIVTVEGKNYPVDVTNADGSSDAGSFLLAKASGSVTRGYTIAGRSYCYDSATSGFWGSGSILSLSKKGYSPDWASDHEHDYGSWQRTCSATPFRIGVKGRSCSQCGCMEIACSATKDLAAAELTVTVSSSSGKPKLSWEAVRYADAYRIYRASSKSGDYRRIKSTSSTSFTDTTAKAGKKYYYKIVALDTDSGKTSGSSNVCSAVCHLARPEITVKLSKGDPKVTWETVSGAEKYYVYRATSKNGEFTKVKTTRSATDFTDTKVKSGKTYYYKVKAVHSNTEASSAWSAVKSVKVK